GNYRMSASKAARYGSGSVRFSILEFTTRCVVSPSAIGSVMLAHDGIAEVDERPAEVAQLGSDDDLFVVVGRRFVAAARIDDGQMTVSIEFHPFVLKSQAAHEFYASYFHPDEEVRVVDNA